jgi:predicted nucleic acid-binding protein
MIALDTDVLIDLWREKPAALGWLAGLGEEPLITPGYAAMELYQGCENKQDLLKTRAVMKKFAVVWPTSSDCDAALTEYAKLRLSHNIGMIDCLIAYTAIGYGAQLATFNSRHYKAIHNLALLQPYNR